MSYIKKKIKAVIRETIAEGMIIASKIHVRENPYAAGEFIEQQSENLNLLSNKAYDKLEVFLEVE